MMSGTMAPRARAASGKGRGITAAAEQQLAHRLITMASALRALTCGPKGSPDIVPFKQAAARLLEAARLQPAIAELDDANLLHHLVWLTATRLCLEPLESLHGSGLRMIVDRASTDAPWQLVMVPTPRSVSARANAAWHPHHHRIGAHGAVASNDLFDCRVGEDEAVFQHVPAEQRGALERGDIHSYYAVASVGTLPVAAVVLTRNQLERQRKASDTADHAVWKLLPHRLGEVAALRELMLQLAPTSPPGPITLDHLRAEGIENRGRAMVMFAAGALQRGVDPFAPFASWEEALQEPLPGTPGEHFAGHAGQTVGRIPRAVLARVRQWLVSLPRDRQSTHARLARAVFFATLTHRLADPMARRKDATS